MNSNIQLKATSVSYKGLREENEDQYDIQLESNPKLFAIYDGHGGVDVSSYLKKELPKYFKNKELPIKKSDIYKSFNELQNELIKNNPTNAQDMGSTCLCALQQNNKLEIINCGDCRCVIGNNKKGIQITTDHKPNEQNEKQRLSKIKGDEEIYLDEDIWRIGPLSVSRSFGDTDTAPYITSKPDIFTYKLNSGDDFMILACDGIWDVMTNKQVVDFIYKNPQNTVRKLASHALKLGSTDNISAIIVYFDNNVNQSGSSTSTISTGGSKTSASKSKTSTNKSNTSASKSKPSTSKSKTSESGSKTSVSKSKTSASKSKTPVSKSKTPVSKSKTPVSKSKPSTSKSKPSASKSNTSASKSNTSASKSNTSASKSKT